MKTMLKKYKWLLLATSLLLLLPCIYGLLKWDALPEQVPVHFNANNEADGYSSRSFAVFGFPAIMLGVHLFTVFATLADPKRANISEKTLVIILFLGPTISLFASAMIYSAALGEMPDTAEWSFLFSGILMMVVGNRLPKSARNYTVGIRIPWTLDDDENWARTHRLGGWCFTTGGLILVLGSRLRSPGLLIGVLLFSSVTPIAYSYLYYLRHKDDPKDKKDRQI